MSYSVYSPTYTLEFTDGSIMTLINVGSHAPTYSGITELIIPNLYWGTFLGDSIHSVKYDKLGNKYDFNNNVLTINDSQTVLASYGRGGLGYNPDNDTIVGISWRTGVNIPYLRKGNWYSEGITWKRDCTGTDFSSFGEAIYHGQEVIKNPPPTYTGWYYLENVTSMSTNAPLYGTTLFNGNRSTGIIGLTFWSGVSQTAPLNIDLHSILNDFDPESPIQPDTDPFEPGGETGPGGGTGNFDGTGDDITIPSLPTLSAVDAGFITIFNPSIAQMKSLASYMWSSFFDIDTFKKIFANPMDCILGLSIVPVAVPSGGSKSVNVGNISTGVNMTVAATQYVEVDCGTLNVNEYWGAYLDYDPYTKAEIYLPYIGIEAIAVDDIMNKAVTVKYHVDILSGACTAYVKCGSSVLYQFIGQCSSSIPISSNDWTNVINGCLSIAGSLAHMSGTGGASAYQDVPKIAATATNSLKPTIEKSGSASGTGGLMGVQTPFLILTRPRQALPRSQNHYTGYPSFMTERFATLIGYTEVEEVHLTGIPGTDEEIKEIAELLEKGVLF